MKLKLKKINLKTIFYCLIILSLLGIWQIGLGHSATSMTTPSPATDETVLDYKIKIPRIGIEAPVILNVDGNDKGTYLAALENGVAQLKGSAKPGEGSNIFIFGHSSYYPFVPGNFKNIFKNLPDLDNHDEIIITDSKKEFHYIITDIQVVYPDEVNVAAKTPSEQLTLMTCVPVGTNRQRLIIIAKPE